MPKGPFVDFRAIKSKVSIEQILTRYGLMETLHGTGETRRGPCPLHGGSNKNQFSVHLTKNIWNCFSDCKSGGNILDFVAKRENVEIHRAAVLISEWFNLGTSPGADQTYSAPVNPQPRAAQSSAKPRQKEVCDSEPNKPLGFELKDLQRQHPYLASRGISEKVAAEFGIGFFSGSKGLMVGRIVIPIHNSEGKLVAYAGRFPGEPDNETPKYKLPPGFKKGLELYNIHRAASEADCQPFIIVEGFFGCIHLWQHGARRVVALMGSSMSRDQESLILRCTSDRTHVVLALDENEAGRLGASEIAPRLALHRFVRIHSIGVEGQQPTDLTQEQITALIGK